MTFVCVGERVAVMSAEAGRLMTSSSSAADVILSSSSSRSSVGQSVSVRPSWLAGATCGLLLDPVLAMKLFASRDSLAGTVAASSTSCDITLDRSTTMMTAASSAADAAAAADTAAARTT